MRNQTQERYIARLLSQLTLEEKIGMIHGATLFTTKAVERLEIPKLTMSDGPMGVRFEFRPAEWIPMDLTDDYVTYLPCNSAVASTWNRELARATGRVLGAEARGRGKDMILAPGINIKRSPLCGRNFEYMSEDPRLIEELVVPLVQGIQENDTAACVKHFAANSQETDRLWVDTIADRRTLEEIYFPGFKAAVDGGVYALMGAYNLLNGESCCQSESLLNEILREAWDFDGVVVSDWGGVHDTFPAARSSLDIEMAVHDRFDEHRLAKPLLEKIRGGELSEELVDRKVRNILRLMLRLKMIGPEREERSPGAYNTAEHRQAALDTARESIILLKNEERLLPLDSRKARKVAVIGGNANRQHAAGGGSAEIKALYEITPLMGIKKLLGGNARVTYAPGYYLPPQGARPEISWQATSTQRDAKPLTPERAAQVPVEYLEEAVRLSRESDTVIFVGGLDHDYDVEGLDRKDMALPYGQDKVLQAVLEANPNTVVVMYAGSPVDMPWLGQAKALVWSYYAGLEGGTALAEVLFGKVNPSGKLAETFLRDLADCPAKQGENFGLKNRVEYTEGVMVGYRHYDTQGTDVNFCFGHGLSYTSFEYSGLAVSREAADGSVSVTLTVANTGAVEGKETVQLYVAPVSGWKLPRPSHELRGFEKISLAPGEKKVVSFTLTPRDFSAYDPDENAFTVIPGRYQIQLGASSRDIRLTEEITVG